MERHSIIFPTLTQEQYDDQSAKIIKLRNRALMNAACSKEPEMVSRYQRLLIERKIRVERKKAEEREKNIESGYLTKVELTENEKFALEHLITARAIQDKKNSHKALPRNQKRLEKERPEIVKAEKKEQSNPIPYNQSAIINPFKKSVTKKESKEPIIPVTSGETTPVVIPTRQGVLPGIPPAKKSKDQNPLSIKPSILPSRSGCIESPLSDESSSSSSDRKKRKINP